MLFERVKDLAKKRNKNLKQVAEEIGLSENAFYKWKNQSPKAET
ncbi:helix-turn-helix domain-containing protein, partial [Soonwooa sp.]